MPTDPSAAAAAINASSLDPDRELMHRQMLSSVSHDLKTPLASIIGSLEVLGLMKDKLTIEKQRALVDVALQEAYRLDNFITNILDMAKLENGMVKVKRENVELAPIISQCLLRMNYRLQGINVDIASNDNLTAVTDAMLLSRVICLVLDNAVKYGGPLPSIYLEYKETSPGVFAISVRDNGVGVPDARMETIFSKYTRYAKGDQQNAGTGLGLAIGRKIMQLLDGDITVANHPEGGAVFTLTFASKQPVAAI